MNELFPSKERNWLISVHCVVKLTNHQNLLKIFSISIYLASTWSLTDPHSWNLEINTNSNKRYVDISTIYPLLLSLETDTWQPHTISTLSIHALPKNWTGGPRRRSRCRCRAATRTSAGATARTAAGSATWSSRTPTTRGCSTQQTCQRCQTSLTVLVPIQLYYNWHCVCWQHVRDGLLCQWHVLVHRHGVLLLQQGLPRRAPEPGRAGQDRAVHHSRYSAVQYCIVQYITVQYCKYLYSAVEMDECRYSKISKNMSLMFFRVLWHMTQELW